MDLIKMRESEFRLQVEQKTATVRIQGDTLPLYSVQNIQLKSASVKNLTWETAQAMQVLTAIDYNMVTLWTEIYRLQIAHDEIVSNSRYPLRKTPGTSNRFCKISTISKRSYSKSKMNVEPA